VQVFEPARIGRVQLPNRVIKSATFEGMSPGGLASDALQRHHVALAQGGVGMTTVAYCAVDGDARTFEHQLHVRAENEAPLARLTAAVHAAGARASLQLGHSGFFSRLRRSDGRAPRGPSAGLNLYGMAVGLPFAPALDARELRVIVERFASAAAWARACGFDAVELHLGHGYLLSQFLSPASNRRRDGYGGSLQGRLRLPLEVLDAVRQRVGDGLAVLGKLNLSDGFAGGLEIDESVQVAAALEAAGLDALVPSGGFTSKNALYLLRGGRPLARLAEAEHNPVQKLALRVLGTRLLRAYPFEELFFLPLARRLRSAVQIPIVLLGGALSLDNLNTALAEGFDFVAMGRALIADPDLIARMQRGEATRSRCNGCNECIAEMELGGVRCVLDDAPQPGAR
jgi:2,4-dienoyl-CoA reductase-like NADH-dependent reductase (Old Yellow Enzyme family)